MTTENTLPGPGRTLERTENMPPAKILDVVPDFPAVNNSYVCVFAQMHTYARINESILLIHRDREPYLGYWNLCGGKIKPGDYKLPGRSPTGELSKQALNASVVAAAKFAALRELKEEVGYDGSFPQYMGHMYSTPFDHPGSYLVHFVRAIVNPSMQAESFEYKDHCLWVPTRQITSPANAMVIVPNMRYIMPLCLVGMQGWCFAEHYLPSCPLHDVHRYCVEIPEFANCAYMQTHKPGEGFFPEIDDEMKEMVAAARGMPASQKINQPIPLCDGPGSGDAIVVAELDTALDTEQVPATTVDTSQPVVQPEIDT